MTFSSKMLLATSAAVLVGAVAAAQLMTSGPAHAQKSVNRAEIEAIVKNYLLENPEVIFEAAERYYAEQEAQASAQAEAEVRAQLPTLMAGGAGHVMGASAAEADVVLVEFFDYNCGVCQRAAGFVVDLAEREPGLQVVLQELPVFHPRSREVAVAALSLANTEDYVPLHMALMSQSGVVTNDRLDVIAKQAGVDAAKIDGHLSNAATMDKLDGQLEISLSLAEALGFNGTPGFIIASPDGSFIRLIPGYDEQMILEAIDEARRA